jgi:hypothetical protein
VATPLLDGGDGGGGGDDGAGEEEEVSEADISHLALYILRSCDENRKENLLDGKESATINDISKSSINLK